MTLERRGRSGVRRTDVRNPTERVIATESERWTFYPPYESGDVVGRGPGFRGSTRGQSSFRLEVSDLDVDDENDDYLE